MKHLLSCVFIFIFSAAIAQNDPAESDVIVPKRKTDFGDSTFVQRFSCGVDISFYQSFRKISSERFPEMIECRNAHENAENYLSAGITVHYQLSKHLQLTTGIYQRKTGFGLEEEIHLNDTLDHEYGTACNVYHATDPSTGYIDSLFSDPRYGFLIDDYHPSRMTMRARVDYAYLSVPVLLRVSIGKKRFSAFLSGGAAADLLTKQYISESFVYGNEETVYGTSEFSSKPGTYLNRWSWSVWGGSGMRFRLSEKTAMELYVNTQWQLSDLFRQKEAFVSGYHEKHYTMGGGVRFYSYRVIRK